ncbi:autotransporter-associated beta strand repeat-containing protein, partial [Desulfococcaceae bacterium OttesenSCG-928-F15]|nr:autotransporter-associated beta strand repeat-containing protein [Desulfococcaceae bacterium OttesenSCG-928-F15]
MTLDYATAVDLKNLLSGSGSVTKTGIGKLTLSGANTNTNTGTFTQSTGDVHLVSNWAGDYTQNAGTTFTSAEGATISGRAAFSGSLALDGNLNVGSLVFNGATIAFDMGTDLFTVTGGGLTFSGSNTLKASFASGIQVGTYDIAVVTGGTIADPGAWSYSLGSTHLDGYNLDARGSGIIRSDDHKQLQLRVALDAINLTWNGTGAADGNLWTNNPSNDTVGNWTNGQAGSLLETKFRDGDSVRFDNSAGQKQVSIGAAVAVGSMTVDNAGYTFTGTGGITSASNLVLQNNASAILANEGSNTFSGTSIENGSTLQIGNANASGNLSGAIFNEGTFVINRSDDYTLDNTVSGTGLTKMAGTGRLTISGANSQSNAFEQASGTVNLQKTWAGDYTQSGGLLTGNGTISGNLVSATNINPDGTLSLTGTANLAGTTLGIRNATDTLAVTGSVSLGNGAGITTIDILNFQTGTYTLVTASGFGGVNIDNTTFTTLVGGGGLTGRQTVDYTQSTANAIIMELDTKGGNLELTWAGADGDSWRAANKWTASGSPETFADGDALSFDASVATPQTINLGTGTNHVAWMNVNGGDFTFTGTGGINGTDEASATTLGNPSGKLSVSGNASLTFANTGSNAFAGGTEIASGSLLTLGLNDASGNLSGDIVNEGTFVINRSDAYTLDNKISGAGLTKMTGTGTLTISGANSQSNAFEQASGTVNLQKTWTGDYTQTGGILTGNSSVAGHADISGTIAPTGTLSLSSATFYGGSTISISTLGTDTISVTGATTFDVTNGKIKVDLGNWTLGTGTILDNSIAGTLDIGATFAEVTLNGQALSGRQTAGLSIENGNLVLTATASNMVRTWTGGNGNSWDKNTTESWQEDDKKFIDGDKLVFDATGALVPAITVSENLTASEMTVDGNVNYTFGGASITTDASAWSGTGTASGKLVKNGTGTATFNNANDFKGGVDLNEGRINIGNNTALGNEEIRMADGTTLGFAGDHTISNPVALTGDATVDTGSNNALMRGKIGGAYTLTKDGLGTLTLDAVNEHGATNISAGRLIAKQAASLGSGNANIGSGATLELDFSDELTNSVSGGGALENKGDIVLSGDHTQFTGTIFVRSGKTTLGDGFHSGGAFDISSTLTGSGQMGDALVVRTGAKLSPGDGGFGTITTGSLTFESGSIYEVEVEPGGTGSDLVIVTGTATL